MPDIRSGGPLQRQAERIRQLKAQGLSAKAVAEQLGLSQRSIFRVLSR